MNMRGHVLHSVDGYGMNIMPLALACGAVFWAADYLRLPGVLPYPRRAVCEGRRCGPGRCSGEPFIELWPVASPLDQVFDYLLTAPVAAKAAVEKLFDVE